VDSELVYIFTLVKSPVQVSSVTIIFSAVLEHLLIQNWHYIIYVIFVFVYMTPHNAVLAQCM